MGTLNFAAIPNYTAEYIARNTLRAVRKYAATEAGKELKSRIEGGETNETGNHTERACG